MASTDERKSFDSCIVVKSPHSWVPDINSWSGYENLSMAELNNRFKHWNTECKFGNMDIAEAAVKIPGYVNNVVSLAKEDYNDFPTLEEWLKHCDALGTMDIMVKRDIFSERKRKRDLQSTAKILRQREVMGTGPTHRFLPIESFKKMKLFEQKFSSELCPVNRMLFNRRGTILVVASSTNELQIWDLMTFIHQEYIVTYRYEFHNISHMELSTDESLLVVGTHKGALCLLDFKKRIKLETTLIFNDSIVELKLTPERIGGYYSVIAMNKQGRFSICRLCYPKIESDSKIIERTFGLVIPPRIPESIQDMIDAFRESENMESDSCCIFAISSCGCYVAATTIDMELCIYTYHKDFKLVCTSSENLPIETIAWAHHSTRFITTSLASFSTVWDEKLNIAYQLKGEKIQPGMDKAYWSANDDWIFTIATGMSSIYVWNAADGAILRHIRTNIKCMVPHPILPNLVAIVNSSNEMQLWDLSRRDFHEMFTFLVDNHFDWCVASDEVAWSPDGTVLIATRNDGKLIMFNLSKGIPMVQAPTKVERIERMQNLITTIENFNVA